MLQACQIRCMMCGLAESTTSQLQCVVHAGLTPRAAAAYVDTSSHNVCIQCIPPPPGRARRPPPRRGPLRAPALNSHAHICMGLVIRIRHAYHRDTNRRAAGGHQATDSERAVWPAPRRQCRAYVLHPAVLGERGGGRSWNVAPRVWCVGTSES